MSNEAELYRRYRPKTLDEVYGQPEAVAILKDWLKRKCVPHAILFSGGSGCGKTTLARILKSELDCSDVDFCEINAADTRGIDTVREIRARMGLAPMGGTCRIYLLDEVHHLSRRSDADAQTAILKMLEDTPRHVYFFLCTTHPEGLLPTIRTRCSQIKVNLLDKIDVVRLVVSVLEKELKAKDFPPDEVVDRIADVSEGSARKALVLLHQVIGLKDATAQMEALQKGDVETESIQVCRALLDPRTRWADMAAILKALKAEPETVRQAVLAYMNKVLLGSGKGCGRAFLIVQVFRDNWFSCPSVGLTASCFEVIRSAE